MAGDSNLDAVSLLLNCDGTVNSTVFVDQSNRAKSVSAVGGAKVVSGGKFNQGAGFASAGYLLAGTSAEFSPGASDFTFEVQASFGSRPTTGGSYMGIMGADNVGVTRGWLLLVDGDHAGKIGAVCFSGGTAYSVYSLAAAPLNTMIHVAAVRNGTSLMLFIDGVLQNTTSIGSAVVNNVAAVKAYIGCNQNGSTPVNSMNGVLDEVRWTIGVARYTSGFTPPSAAFPNYVATLSGNVEDETGANAARSVVAILESTMTAVGSTTSDAGTGLYAINTRAVTEHTLIAYPPPGDPLPALVLSGVIPI